MSNWDEKFSKKGYTFDDVVLLQGDHALAPEEIDLSTQIAPNLQLNIPVLSASMDTVTEAKMATALAQQGGLGVVHKNMSIDDQAGEVAKVKAIAVDKTVTPKAATDDQGRLLVAAAVGVTSDTFDRATALFAAGADAIVIDTAHGHSAGVLRKIAEIRGDFPTRTLIAGNVATLAGADALFQAGVDVVKVGIGPGSICTTRVVAGVGVPQFTAINDAAVIAKQYGKAIIADGGIKNADDITKAIAAGGNAVMVGSMLAGTDEAPGEVFTGEDGKKYKTYRGMGSIGAMQRGSSDRYFQGGVNEANKLVPEGIEGRTAYKGAAIDVIGKMMDGLKVNMGYLNTKTINDLVEDEAAIQVAKTFSAEDDAKISFDNVLLQPAASKVLPNNVSLATKLAANIELHMPIVSTSAITDANLALVLAQQGALGVITSDLAVAAQAKEVGIVKSIDIQTESTPNAATDSAGRLLVAAAVKADAELNPRIDALLEAGVDAVVLETADPAVIKAVRTNYPDLTIFAGDIVDPAIAKEAYANGADVILVGAVAGETTHLTDVLAVAKVAAQAGKKVIANGGVKYSGDIVKALSAGANAVMLDSMLAGTDEARQGDVAVTGTENILAGYEEHTTFNGSAADVLFQMMGGLRSGMGYTGAGTIDELIEKAAFVQITQAGLIESHPHDVQITKSAPNYSK